MPYGGRIDVYGYVCKIGSLFSHGWSGGLSLYLVQISFLTTSRSALDLLSLSQFHSHQSSSLPLNLKAFKSLRQNRYVSPSSPYVQRSRVPVFPPSILSVAEIFKASYIYKKNGASASLSSHHFIFLALLLNVHPSPRENWHNFLFPSIMRSIAPLGTILLVISILQRPYDFTALGLHSIIMNQFFLFSIQWKYSPVKRILSQFKHISVSSPPAPSL